jgi:hypothetical protein
MVGNARPKIIFKNMSMDNVKLLINKLKTLVDYYRGVSEQKDIYIMLLQELRELYEFNKTAFSNDNIVEINKLKNKITKYENYFLPDINPQKPVKLKNGVVVLHASHFFVGVIDGSTKLRHLFEDKNNEEEFRVRISKDKVKIASPKELIIIGSAYTSHCYKCKNFVGYSLDRCNRCKWFVCLHCGACGCGYHKRHDFDN